MTLEQAIIELRESLERQRGYLKEMEEQWRQATRIALDASSRIYQLMLENQKLKQEIGRMRNGNI